MTRQDAGFDEDEPLVEGLDKWPAGTCDAAPPDGLRAAVWRRTSASVRWRTRRRWGLMASAAVVAYVAGLGTMYAAQGTERPAARPTERVADATEAVEEVIQEPALVAAPLSPDALMLSDPEAFAIRVSTGSLEDRVKTLREAGDRCLRKRGDVRRALACYRRLLQILPEARRGVVEPGDSWLLIALKETQRRNEDHEKTST